jgi:hypothetical protein
MTDELETPALKFPQFPYPPDFGREHARQAQTEFDKKLNEARELDFARKFKQKLEEERERPSEPR